MNEIRNPFCIDFGPHFGPKLAPSWVHVGPSWPQVGSKMRHKSNLGAILAPKHPPRIPRYLPGTHEGPPRDPPGTPRDPTGSSQGTPRDPPGAPSGTLQGSHLI